MTETQTLSALDKLTATYEIGDIQKLPFWSQIKAQDVIPAVDQLIQDITKRFEALEKTQTVDWDSLMLPLEQIEHDLGRPLGLIAHLQSVCFDQELKKAYDDVRPKLIDLGLKISQSQPLFKHLSQLQQMKNLNPTRQRIVDEQIKAMKLAGVDLPADKQAQFKTIKLSLAEKSQTFQVNLLEAAKNARIKVTEAEHLTGLPAAIIQLASDTAVSDGLTQATPETGPWHFTVNASNYIPIISYAEHQPLREAMYKAFKSQGTDPDFDNTNLVHEILSLRQQQAKLLGFEHYADLSLHSKMASSVEEVQDLLDQIQTPALPAAQKEILELKTFVQTQTGQKTVELEPWDVMFWKEQYTKAHYCIDQEKLREYLPVERVLAKLFTLTEGLFDITIHQTTAAELDTWHPDVSFYEIQENGKTIAGFYMDLYARSGEKREGAWMNTVVDRSTGLTTKNTNHCLPVALFVMNARPPSAGTPALFSLDETSTLFHEFGHALQHMLTKIDEGQASGLNLIEWDAVEIASQFNELWLEQKDFLQDLTSHYNTHEPLDEATLDNIIKSHRYWSGNANLRQLFFAKTDLAIHKNCGHDSKSPDPYDIEKKIRQDLILTPFLPSESQLPAFSHLFSGGYAAGYYSYKWAEVIAADAFEALHCTSVSDIEKIKPQAKRYRESILAMGGSQPAAQIVKDFLGREPNAQALLKQQGLADFV